MAKKVDQYIKTMTFMKRSRWINFVMDEFLAQYERVYCIWEYSIGAILLWSLLRKKRNMPMVLIQITEENSKQAFLLAKKFNIDLASVGFYSLPNYHQSTQAQGYFLPDIGKAQGQNCNYIMKRHIYIGKDGLAICRPFIAANIMDVKGLLYLARLPIYLPE